MPADLSKQYEKLLQQAIKRATAEIRKIYERSIVEISLSVAGNIKINGINQQGTTLVDRPFSLSLFPVLNQKIETLIDRMHLEIYNQIVKSVEQAWNLSNVKNDLIVDKRLAGKGPTNQRARQILYDPNKQAFTEFLNRKERGLNLSDRVWNSLVSFKKEMEQALGLSINKGQSAASMARELKQYLNNPDKLFRRVQSEDGKLALSKAARNYHPGQGVYRSSYKNALRLTATENNLAYRKADTERWQRLPFVIGIRVHTSNNHPTYDICDTLEGLYPKDFDFSGWHPFCRCYAVPEMMNDADYNRLEDAILSGKQAKTPKKLLVSKAPASFTKYLSDNKKRIAGWSNKPYWYRNNKKYI